MYLTHIRLGDHAQRAANNNTRWLHQRIAELSNGRALWAHPRPGVVILQSPAPIISPTWGQSIGQALLNPVPVGAVVRVAMIASPARAERPSPQARGVRRPLQENDWEGWLKGKLGAAITLEEVQTEPLPRVQARKPGVTATLSRVAYQASGIVTDERLLHHLRETGVGPGKAYGCGLLLAVEVTP